MANRLAQMSKALEERGFHAEDVELLPEGAFTQRSSGIGGRAWLPLSQRERGFTAPSCTQSRLKTLSKLEQPCS